MNGNNNSNDNSMMVMMAAMMAICLGVVSLAVLAPNLGVPAAIGVAIALGAVMLVGHQLFMRRGGHR